MIISHTVQEFIWKLGPERRQAKQEKQKADKEFFFHIW